VRLQHLARALEAASRLLEAAGDGQRLALIPQMGLQLTPGNRTRITSLGAGQRSPGALGRMQRQCVRRELPLAVGTASESLGAVLGLVKGHPAAQDPLAALGLAVNRLLAAAAVVLLQSGAGEFALAELATGSPHRAGVLQVIGHHDPWDLGSALVGTLGGIVFAGVEMALQLSQLIRPLAALFVVNAEDQGAHDVFGIGTGIDL